MAHRIAFAVPKGSHEPTLISEYFDAPAKSGQAVRIDTGLTMLIIRDLSIARKLTWMNMLVSGSALLLACAGFVTYEVMSFRESIVRRLSIEAQIVGSNSASALLFNDARSAESTLAALEAAPNILSAGIFTADGRQFAAYGRQHGAPILPLLAPLAGQTDAHEFENNQIVLIRSIVFQGKPIGSVYI